MKITSEEPARADQRLILLLLKDHSDLYTHRVGMMLSQRFVRAGGSWSEVFLGSVDAMSLLRQIVKEFVKHETR